MGRADGPGSESEGNSHGGGSSGGGNSGGGGSGGGGSSGGGSGGGGSGRGRQDGPGSRTEGNTHSGLGNDILYGGDNDDRLFGGDGHDVVQGDLGTDIMTGGDGRDVFIVMTHESTPAKADRITDFSDGDRLLITRTSQVWYDRVDTDKDGVDDATTLYNTASGGRIYAVLKNFVGPLDGDDFYGSNITHVTEII